MTPREVDALTVEEHAAMVAYANDHTRRLEQTTRRRGGRVS